MARRPDAEITDPGYNSRITDENPSQPKILKPLRKETPDYVESLLEAIDTTVTTRIQQAQLDKTVLCTILESDWTNVEAGEYYVSEGDAKYLVKGEENAYRTGERVWVLIPCGDYNNQKTIISRQVGDVGDSFVYISPLENFVRLTEDIVPNTSKGRYSLKTNDFTKVYGTEVDDEGNEVTKVVDVDKNDSILIASIDMTKASAVDIDGFSVFGISAKFKTDVAGLEIMRGNYGLHLVVTSVKEEIVGTTNGAQKSEHDEAIDHLYLQCDDMWGNPYGYDMFFEQSKMFEINDPGRTKIKKIDVYFFQTYDEHDERGIVSNVDAMQSGKFVDINQRDIDSAPLEDNLFMQELSIYFGHTADNLNTGAYLYSQNSPNFIIKDGNPKDINDKTLVAKFIHTDRAGKHYVLNSLGNNSIYQQLLDTGSIPDEFTVRWYAYNPLSTENDLRAGSGWEDITDKGSVGKVVQINKYGEYELIDKSGAAYTDTNRTYRLNDADAGYEKFKVAYILFDSGLDGKTAPTEEDVASANAAINDTDKTYTQAEKEAAQQVLDNYDAFSKEQRYWSIDLTFTNGDDQTWGSLDALNSLRLEFDDNGYNGNYLIYNTAVSGQAKMLNSSDAHVKRKLIGYFKSYITGETDLTRNTIRWYIPKSNTMISEPDWKDELFTGYKFDSQEGTYTNQNPALRWEPLNGKKATYNATGKAWVLGEPGARPSTDMDSVATWDKYYIFESVIDTSKTSGLQDLKDGKVTIQYRVKEYWNQHFTNNTIMCKIIRDGKLYEKSVDLRFGAHGVNGTEYSLIVELGDEYTADGKLVAEKVPAWTWTHPLDNYIVLNAQLYDERNKAITENITYTWKIEDFKNSGKLHPVIADNGNALRVLDNTESSNLFKLQNGNRLTRQGDYVDYRYLAGAYLKCTATHKGNQYTQYLLVPMRRNEQYIGCVGATAVTYTYANTAPAVSSKDAYQVLDVNYNLCGPSRTFSIYESSYIKNLEHVGNDNVKKIYSDLPYLSNIKKLNSTEPATLVLPPTYYQDMQYKMAVKMEVGGQLVWVQPILITLDVFTNSFLNQWDGSLQIDNKNNRIATAAVFSGKKNADNTFTGVIMGELQGEQASSNEIGYGIYGRNNGNHTFGINTNGTAYLGDSTQAQLMFKAGVIDKNNNEVWESTIQNAGYTSNSQKGMKLDFLGTTSRRGGTAVMNAPYIDIINPASEDNKINRITMSGNASHLLEVFVNANVAPGGSGNSKKQILHVGNDGYYLQTEGYTEGSKGTKIDLQDGSFKSFNGNGGKNNTLLISSVGYQLDTNDEDAKFKVNGNAPGGSGWVLYSHGNFGVDTTGKIHAKAGTIGGWNISSTSLYTGTLSMEKTDVPASGDVRLSSSNFARKICNQEGSAWRLTIGPNFGVTSGGKLYATGAEFSGTIRGSSITGGTISGSSISGGTISGGDISGGTISGSSISGGSVIGSNVHADNLYLNGSRVYYDTTNVVGIIKGIDLSLDGRTLSAKARFTYKTIYGFGMSDSYEHGSTSESPWGSSVTLPSSGGGGGGGDDSGCILKGTPILMADYSYKNIENIKDNDMVLSYNEQTQTYEPAIVSIGATPFPSHYIYDICLENGEILSLTGSHPLLTTEGWKALNIEMAYKEHKVRTQLLHTGDEVLSINNETYRIKQIIAQPYAENYEVYNIVVPKNKTYFANNLIVHNAGNDDKVIH